MPAILERLVSQLQGKGYSKSSAYAIATKSLQKAGDLKPGSREATAKGTSRGAMSPGARAVDRARKYSKKKRPTSAYSYNSKTNRAKLKKV